MAAVRETRPIRYGSKAEYVIILDFQSRIVDSLMREDKVVGRVKLSSPTKRAKKACASKIPPSEIRYGNTGHLPTFIEKQQMFKHCKTDYSRIQCCKCDVPLCIIKDRNCFYEFHTKY